jgi:hypothetical protein
VAGSAWPGAALLTGIDFQAPEQQQSLIVDNRSISGTANEGG